MKRLSFVCMIAFTIFLFTNCRKDDNGGTGVKPAAVDFTIADTGIHVNPNGFTPLSAQLNFNSVKSGRTFIKIHGRHGALSDVTHLFSDNGDTHSIPVIGMYADTTNTVDIRIVDANGDTLAQSTVSITTQALPQDMPTSIVTTVLDESKAAPGMYLVSNFSNLFNTTNQPLIPYIMDDYGDIRWILDYSSEPELKTLYYDDGIARLKNGNFYFASTATSKIYEVDVLGKVIDTWSLGDYVFHHEVHEETNGNFIMTATKPANSTYSNGAPSIEDFVIEIDRSGKQVSNVWDMKESLDEYRRTWGVSGVDGSDWFHGNAVTDDSTDNTIIVSGRNQGVVKLDRTNHVKWILAPHKDWGVNRRGEDLKHYLLTPLDASGNVIADTSVAYGSAMTSDFEWNCYQHSPILLPNGHLMIFDNGTNRTLDPTDGNNVYNSAPGKYSRAVEFKIDTTNMTVQQVWQYGKERDVECYSSIISDVQFLPESNHVIFAPGAFVPNEGGKGGKVIEIDYATRQVINEIHMSSSNNFGAHRIKKISVYPANL